MMAILTVAALAKDLLQGFQKVAGKDWPVIESYAKKSSEALAHCLVKIETLKVKGELTEEQAQTMLSIEKDVSQASFLVIDQLKQEAVNDMIESAVSTVKQTVNTALGWGLI